MEHQLLVDPHQTCTRSPGNIPAPRTYRETSGQDDNCYEDRGFHCVTVANVRTGMSQNPRNMASLRQNLVTVATFRTRLFQNPRNMLRPQRNRVTVATFQARICQKPRKTHIPKQIAKNPDR